MFERRPSPAILAIGGLIALVGAVLILTGWVDLAAGLGGFIPLRVGADAGGPDVPVWLTPLTAMLIHDGWLHLGFNLLTLAIVGTPTQRAVGLRGVLVLLLVGAYAAVAAQWAVDPTSPVPMIGASGAISALIGAYALLFGSGRARAIGPVPAHVVHAVWLGVSWTLFNMAIGWASAGGGMPIAGAAHAGGFVAGMVLLRPLLRWRWGGGRVAAE
ncbi:rhomboid family intramembrane serine protease [Sphingomonas sp. 2R-10]|uniref:rhomboid family intramembrane serine protease n=1 Tax=Sphingomonas sp. 2R-10 TaxID=3045148 RepID=UPI000F7720CC|nr:rhomboid family intramembrane serine protease [Sphingomonas sp. 2R-10]MDJ0278078.1 rhomboid family intramembrane serine protease [Sphingomonas sp. 2R-10]